MQQYLPMLVVLALFLGWRAWSGWRIRGQLLRILGQGAAVIDVRSAGEYSRGHVEGSRNIPLDQLAGASLPADQEQWLVVCCASGTRSAMARSVLRRRGFRNVINGGSWINVARCTAK